MANISEFFYVTEKEKNHELNYVIDSILVQNDRVDDIISTNSEQKNSLLSCPFSSVIALDQAIGFYPKPRIVAESNYPFTVVHANGRFSNLSKLQSDEVIGQRLSNIVLSFNLSKLLLDCIKESEIGSEVIVDVLSGKTNSTDAAKCPKQESIRCFMTVFPVVPNFDSKSGVNDEMMKVTHFVLELKKCNYPLLMYAQS